MGVTRDSNWVSREYGQEKWPQVARWIADCIADEGPAPALARVLGRVARLETYEGGPVSLAEGPAVVGRVSVPALRSVTFGGYQRLVLDAVAAACTPQTDLIVELGAGWGRNLLSLWLAGAPRETRYVAAEFTEAGRDAAAVLAALEPGLRFEALPFDYHQPDLAACRGAAEAVVFTSHSVEQIPRLAATLVDEISGVAARVRCLHFEPVGWQVDPAATGSSEEHAAAHDYNRDLVAALREHEARGAISIDTVLVEPIGLAPANASTIIGWSAPGR